MATPAAPLPSGISPSSSVPKSSTPSGFAAGPGFPAQSSPNGATGQTNPQNPSTAPLSGPAQPGSTIPGAGVPGAATPGQTVTGGAAAGAGSGAGPAAAGGAHGAGPAGSSGHALPDPKHINPYIYVPSFSMAIVGSVMFLLSSFLHTFQLFKYKCWYFNLIPQAALISAIGMIARTHSIITLKETGATGPFVVFMFTDMIAPALLIFGAIFTMTRVIWWVTPNDRRNIQTLWAPPKMISLTWGFTCAIPDIVKSVGQNAFKPHDPLGMKIQVIGQVLQVFAFGGFFLFSVRFMKISRRWLIHGACEEKRWRNLGWTVCGVAGLLAFHHIFSVVAFDARVDPKSFWSQHEWMYWITEPIPLFLCYTLFNLNHPGEFLPRDYTRFKLNLKEIEKAKSEVLWPLQISSPIRNDDKGVEITLTELENGRRYEVGRN